MVRGALFLAGVVILIPACVSPPDTKGRLWPIHDREETVTGGREVDSPFPFGRWWDEPDTTSSAIRPLYRREYDRERDRVRHEFLWPLVKFTEEPGRKQTWVLPLVYDRTIVTEQTGKRDRDWMVFPFFGGYDSEKGPYFLLFPFFGSTQSLFGSEEIRYRFFPLYVEAKDREYRSNYVLWPLIGWGKGGGKTMFRILPFYGTKENEGKSWRRNLLWPFFSWGEEELHTKYPIRYFFFFPFYGENRSEAAWQTTVLYPFFMFSGSKRGWRERQILWPIYRDKVHPNEWAQRVWPLFGESEFYDAETGELESRQNYYLWPLIWDSEFLVPTGRHEYTLFVPFYRRSRYFSVSDEDRGGDVQVWPLFRKRVHENGMRVVSFLAPIPFSDWRSFEEHWSWLWTVIEARQTPDGEVSQKYLWGLIRYRSGKKGSYTGLTLVLEHARDDVEESEKVHLLKGLLGWERSKEGAGLRLLWFVRIPL